MTCRNWSIDEIVSKGKGATPGSLPMWHCSHTMLWFTRNDFKASVFDFSKPIMIQAIFCLQCYKLYLLCIPYSTRWYGTHWTNGNFRVSTIGTYLFYETFYIQKIDVKNKFCEKVIMQTAGRRTIYVQVHTILAMSYFFIGLLFHFD